MRALARHHRARGALVQLAPGALLTPVECGGHHGLGLVARVPQQPLRLGHAAHQLGHRAAMSRYESGPPMIGRSFADYRIEEVLGRGSVGAVYRATRQADALAVALKVVHQSLLDEPTALARFEREAKAIARLEHPGCIRLLDWGSHDGVPYIATELVDGRVLRELLRDQGALSQDAALRIGVEVCAVLEAAHRLGIVHRDLKPANIMVLGGGRGIKIFDFGVAKLLHRASENDDSISGLEPLTELGSVVGTPTHMAPEVVSGATADHRLDLYACGVLLYELCTGRLPFEHHNPLRLMQQILEEAPVAPRERAAGIDPAVDALILRCLTKRPEDRFQSARALGGALLEALSQI